MDNLVNYLSFVRIVLILVIYVFLSLLFSAYKYVVNAPIYVDDATSRTRVSLVAAAAVAVAIACRSMLRCSCIDRPNVHLFT